MFYGLCYAYAHIHVSCIQGLSSFMWGTTEVYTYPHRSKYISPRYVLHATWERYHYSLWNWKYVTNISFE